MSLTTLIQNIFKRAARPCGRLAAAVILVQVFAVPAGKASDADTDIDSDSFDDTAGDTDTEVKYENPLSGKLTIALELLNQSAGDVPEVAVEFQPYPTYEGKTVELASVCDSDCVLIDNIDFGSCCYYNNIGDYKFIERRHWTEEFRKLPFVNHPDQWDDFVLRIKNTPPTDFESLTVEYAIDGSHSYIFVDSFDTEAAEVTPVADGNDTVVILEDHIRERREALMESVVEQALEEAYSDPYIDIDFDNLPLSLREAAHDHGQSGTEKYAKGVRGHCNITQSYYQMLATEIWTTDFDELNNYSNNDPDNGLYYVRGAPWPIDNGNRVYWLEDKDSNGNYGPQLDRHLARVRFQTSGTSRTGLDPDVPFALVQMVYDGGGNPVQWAETGEPYTPKIGDMLWRWDRCAWHTSSPHAMILVSEPYFDGADLMTPIFEGSSQSRMRNRTHGSKVDDYIDGPCADAECCGNFAGSGLCTGVYTKQYDPDAGPVDTDSEFYLDTDGHYVEEFWPVQLGNNSKDVTCFGQDKWVHPYRFDPGVDVDGPGEGSMFYCPPGAGLSAYHRFDFYVGEVFHPEEWYAFPVGANTWHRLGTDVLMLPVDDALRNPSDLPALRNPRREELAFADFDGDGVDDVLWRNSETNVLEIQYSSDEPGDAGWWYAGMGSTWHRLLTGQLGEYGSGPPGDDLLELVEISDAVMLMRSVWVSKDFGFAMWDEMGSIPTLNSAEWVADHIRLTDFDNDDYTDIFYKNELNEWQVLYGGSTDWVTVKQDEPMSLSRYRFADFDGDGDTDILRIMIDGFTGAATWEVSRWISYDSDMGDFEAVWVDDSGWAYRADAEDEDLRLGDFDEDPRADVLYKNADDGAWYMLYNFDFDRGWRRVYIDLPMSTPLGEVALGNFISDDGMSVPHSEIFIYRTNDILAKSRVVIPPVEVQAEYMTHTSGESVTDGWRLTDNGGMYEDFDFQGGVPGITVTARGERGSRPWPNMVVRVGEDEYNLFVESADWRDYRFVFKRPAAVETIGIELDNDDAEGGADRSLVVDEIIVRSHRLSHACDDGEQNGDETDVDCGGSCDGCEDGRGCLYDDDCENNSCVSGICQIVPPCTEETAEDMGTHGNSVTVDNNGCLMVRDDYPEWWGVRTMKLESTAVSGGPAPFYWSNSCAKALGSATFTAAWQERYIGPTSDQCATLIRLEGAGDGTVTLRYWDGGEIPGVCGDGTLSTGEECDDGNTTDGDGCSATCTIEGCDDGVINGDETDVDCGGEECPACEQGEMCGEDADCLYDSCIDGICQAAPGTLCSGICSDPVTLSSAGSYPNIGTGELCVEYYGTINGGNCYNFAYGRTLEIDGVRKWCTGGNWHIVPEPGEDGGYCIHITAGGYEWAGFTLW